MGFFSRVPHHFSIRYQWPQTLHKFTKDTLKKERWIENPHVVIFRSEKNLSRKFGCHSLFQDPCSAKKSRFWFVEVYTLNVQSHYEIFGKCWYTLRIDPTVEHLVGLLLGQKSRFMKHQVGSIENRQTRSNVPRLRRQGNSISFVIFLSKCILCSIVR